MDRFDNLTLRERITAHLRSEILSNRIAPGTAAPGGARSPSSWAPAAGPIREALGVAGGGGPGDHHAPARRGRHDAHEGRVPGGLPGARGARVAGRAAGGARHRRRRRWRPWPTPSGTWSARRPGADVDLFFDANTAFHCGAHGGVGQPQAGRDPPPAGVPDGPLPPALRAAARQPGALHRGAPGDPGRGPRPRRGARHGARRWSTSGCRSAAWRRSPRRSSRASPARSPTPGPGAVAPRRWAAYAGLPLANA